MEHWSDIVRWIAAVTCAISSTLSLTFILTRPRSLQTTVLDVPSPVLKVGDGLPYAEQIRQKRPALPFEFYSLSDWNLGGSFHLRVWLRESFTQIVREGEGRWIRAQYVDGHGISFA